MMTTVVDRSYHITRRECFRGSSLIAISEGKNISIPTPASCRERRRINYKYDKDAPKQRDREQDQRPKKKDKGESGEEIITPSPTSEIISLRKELQLRTELARVASSFTRPDDLLSNILSLLCEGFGANGGAVYLMDRGTKEITLKASYGLDHNYAMKYQKINLGSHVTGKVAQTGEGMIIVDSAVDGRSTKGVVEILRYRSAVVTPVTSEGAVIGIIALISETPGFFTENDLKMLGLIGAQISLAIVNSFLDQEIREEKERMLDILERLDEGLFEAELIEPLSPDRAPDRLAVIFLEKAYFTLINDSFKRQSGDEIWLGASLESGFDTRQFLPMLREVLSKGEVKGIERRWSGEIERIFEVSMVRVDVDGKIKGLKGTRRDVTGRSRMDRDLRDLRSKAEFYMDVLSHDISNVNTSVMGFLDLIEDRLNTSGEIRNFVSITREQIKHSSMLVQKVKVLQNIRKETSELSMTDVSGKIQSYFDIVKRQFPGKTAVLEMDPRPFSIVIRADEFIDDLFKALFRMGMENRKDSNIEIHLEIKAYIFDEVRGFLMTFSYHGCSLTEDLGDGPDIVSRPRAAVPGKVLDFEIAKSIVSRYGGKMWVERCVESDPVGESRIMVFLPSGSD